MERTHLEYLEEILNSKNASDYLTGYQTMTIDALAELLSFCPHERLCELAQADKEGRVIILPFKTPGWGWSCRKGYPTPVEAYYPFPSSVMRETETGYFLGSTKEKAEAALRREQDEQIKP